MRIARRRRCRSVPEQRADDVKAVAARRARAGVAMTQVVQAHTPSLGKVKHLREQREAAVSRARTTPDDASSARPDLLVSCSASARDLHLEAVDIGARHVLHGEAAEHRQNVVVEVSPVSSDTGPLLVRLSVLGKVALRKPLYGRRIAGRLPVGERVKTILRTHQMLPRPLASLLQLKDGTIPDRHAPGPPTDPILDDVGLRAGWFHPDPKPWQLVIPKDDIAVRRAERFDGTLSEFHGSPLLAR